MKKPWRAITASLALLLSTAASSSLPKPAPNCPLRLGGGNSTIKQLAGKVVYVDFWASWCVSCIASFPFMERLSHDLAPSGLDVIAVNVDRRPDDAARFLARHRVTFPIAMGANEGCAKQFGVAAMPSTFLVDRRGNIRAVHSGFRPEDGPGLRNLVERLLAEPARP